MPFKFTRLAIPDVIKVDAQAFSDNRGFFKETYKESEFLQNGIIERFVQDNVSWSHQGVLRGLHFQTAPHAQGKLVSSLQGEIFDVAVDIRRSSPTYGRWISEVLSAENHLLLYIPPGFAHGFVVLSGGAIVSYKATAEYAPALDGGIAWNDPDIGIAWPVASPTLSKKDGALPRLRDITTV